MFLQFYVKSETLANAFKITSGNCKIIIVKTISNHLTYKNLELQYYLALHQLR